MIVLEYSFPIAKFRVKKQFPPNIVLSVNPPNVCRKSLFCAEDIRLI